MRYLLAILFCVCAGCASPKRPRMEYVQPFVLVVMDGDTLYPRRGYCDQKHRFIYVRYDGDKPDFYALGHEVWHLPELGGRFHK